MPYSYVCTDDISIRVLSKDNTFSLCQNIPWTGYQHAHVVIRSIRIFSYRGDICLLPAAVSMNPRSRMPEHNMSSRKLLHGSLIFWTASCNFCAWKRSVTRRVSGKKIRAVCSILGAISRVNSLNWNLLPLGSCNRMHVTVLISVPFMIAIILTEYPFFLVYLTSWKADFIKFYILVTVYIMFLILHNPPVTADIKEKLLDTEP